MGCGGVGGEGAARCGLQALMASNACFAVGRSVGSVAKHKSISCSISAGHSSGAYTEHSHNHGHSHPPYCLTRNML